MVNVPSAAKYSVLLNDTATLHVIGSGPSKLGSGQRSRTLPEDVAPEETDVISERSSASCMSMSPGTTQLRPASCSAERLNSGISWNLTRIVSGSCGTLLAAIPIGFRSVSAAMVAWEAPPSTASGAGRRLAKDGVTC
eukprot:scaffold2663_cov256-Pinguiococcus_pyrenoidosus.AAC.1